MRNTFLLLFLGLALLLGACGTEVRHSPELGDGNSSTEPEGGVNDDENSSEGGDDSSGDSGDGESSDDSGGDGGDDEVEETPPLEVSLTASKSYKPSRWNNASYTPESELEFFLPEKLEVTAGNAGNHLARLEFDGVECFYQGGADVSKPLKDGNSTQISKGLWYHFQNCYDSLGAELSLEAGDSITSSVEVFLQIENGDSTETTTVELTLLGYQ